MLPSPFGVGSLAQNQFVSAANVPVDADYLVSWHYLRLAQLLTSDGHVVALPMHEPWFDNASAGLRVDGTCHYSPAAPAWLRAIEPKSACDEETCAATRYIELGVLGGGTLLLGLLLVLVMPFVFTSVLRRLHILWSWAAGWTAQTFGARHLAPLQEPLLPSAPAVCQTEVTDVR